jgi:hypothetical protein
MIVSVRGPCGGGKSTTVRSYVREVGASPVFVPGRRIPYGYVDGKNSVFVVGRYDRDTMGGADSFQSLHEVFLAIDTYAPHYRHVVFEGKTQNNDIDRFVALGKRYELAALSLDVTAEQAVAGVRGRATANQISSGLIERTCRKCAQDDVELRVAGVALHRAKREDALPLLRRLLR